MKNRLNEFEDLLAFLRSYSEERRRGRPGWSYGAWAKKLKLSGTASLTMVLNGQREPGSKFIGRLVEYFGFQGEEREYFLDLARLHRFRRDPSLSSFFLLQLQRRRKLSSSQGVTPIPLSLFNAISRWHYYAIREMPLLEGFREDPDWIRDRLLFSVSRKDVEQALRDLVDLKLLTRSASGALVPTPATIDTPLGVQDAAIQDFHRQMLELGKRALKRIPASEREFSSTTLTVNRESIPRLKELLRKFQDEFCAEADVSPGDSTYQLNLQLFPLACALSRYNDLQETH